MSREASLIARSSEATTALYKDPCRLLLSHPTTGRRSSDFLAPRSRGRALVPMPDGLAVRARSSNDHRPTVDVRLFATLLRTIVPGRTMPAWICSPEGLQPGVCPGPSRRGAVEGLARPRASSRLLLFSARQYTAVSACSAQAGARGPWSRRSARFLLLVDRPPSDDAWATFEASSSGGAAGAQSARSHGLYQCRRKS